MAIDWDYPTPYTKPLVVSKPDIDGLGHTNNNCYAVWCEQCAWEHSGSLGLSVADYQKLDRGVAIQHADYDYFLPTFLGDALITGTWLVHCDRRLRLERRFQIIRPASNETVMRGHWLLVSVVLSTGKVTRLPQLFVDTYAAAVVRSE